MDRLINIIGATVLCGILLKLSYVFVYLFGELDNDSLMSKITGVTFAFASIYFVVKVQKNWLKITMVALDMCTILYFYMHEKFSIDIEYAALIIATYSGLIIYFLGRTVNEVLNSVTDTETKRLRNEADWLRFVIESMELRNEIAQTRRRISESRTDATAGQHRKRLEELEARQRKLNSHGNITNKDFIN